MSSNLATLAALLEGAPLGVAVLAAPSLECSHANQLWRRWLGERVVGRSLREVLAIEGTALLELLDRTCQSREPASLESCSLPLAEAGGARLLNVCVQPVFTAEPAALLVIACEVTAAAHERERLEAMMAGLEQESRAKDELISTVAHELRNPLASIKMALSLLDAGADASTARRYRVEAAEQLAGLETVLDELLDLSRLARGNLRLREERFELGPAISAAVESARPRLAQRHLQLDTRLAPGPFPLIGDPLRVQHAAYHALERAARRSRADGRIELSLDSRAINGGTEARLSLRDAGPTLSPEEQKALFEPFAAARDSFAIGAGLAVARVVIELHGGSVETIDQGRELVFHLPLADGAQGDRRPALSRPVSALPHRRVLVVEDSDEQRAMLAAALESLGQRASAAREGEEALALMLADAPDLAFIDVGLPGLDGYTVARRIRASQSRQPILVALTGYGGPAVQELCDKAGFDLCLTKPLSLRALETILRATRILRPRRPPES